METRTIEIGYVLKGYPRTSETFIINEIFLLEREQRLVVGFDGETPVGGAGRTVVLHGDAFDLQAQFVGHGLRCGFRSSKGSD